MAEVLKNIRLLTRKDNAAPIIRNSLRELQDMDVPVKYHGELMSACFGFIESPTTPVAIKAYSLAILQKLSGIYPEIKPELKVIIEERWEHETAAFHSRARKILKEIK